MRADLARAAAGEAFLLLGGDCAESFAEFHANAVRDTLKVLLQMAVVLSYAAGAPVVKVARMAGQFAKPRSSMTETIGATTLPSYFGDVINGAAFTAAARTPDPGAHAARLQPGGDHAEPAARVHPGRVRRSASRAAMEPGLRRRLAAGRALCRAWRARIEELLGFMTACGIDPARTPQLRTTAIYTAHDALLLPYEEALTRQDSLTGDWYGCSAHLLWLGDRTRQPDHAHAAFARGVANPLGMKCGPTLTADELLRLLDVLNPDNAPGRMTLITRMGAATLAENLPKLLRAVQREGRAVVWCCDPMHGNTVTLANGRKTRAFERILEEVRVFFAVHEGEGTKPGGVHLEMTGKDVTECLGGGQQIAEADLSRRYQTQCDPRLNGTQALELAFLVAELLREARRQRQLPMAAE